MPAPQVLALPITRLLDEIASGEPGPTAGAGSDAVLAVGAGVAAACGRASRQSWRRAGGAIAQADVRAFEEASATLHSGDAGDAAIGAKLGRAAEVPLAIARAGADVATLAREIATRGDPAMRADAAACALAAGATQAAAHLVEVNLAVTEGDPWLAESCALARDAAEASRRSTA